MNSPILRLAKYEVMQYFRGTSDTLVIILLVLGGIASLFMPMTQSTDLPSSSGLYRIGYWEEHPLIELARGGHVLNFVRFSGYDAMYNSLAYGEVDASVEIIGGNSLIVYSTDVKSMGAASRLEQTLKTLVPLYYLQEANQDPDNAGIYLPIMVRVIEEEIDYSKTLAKTFQASREEIQREVVPEIAGKRFESYEERIPVSNAESVFQQPAEGAANATDEGGFVLPSQISLEFPFAETLKNIMIIGPAIMMSMLMTLSLMKEKLTKSMHNLFEAPLRKWEIVIGKGLPYFMGMLLLSVSFGFLYSGGMDALKVSFIIASISLLCLSLSLFTVVSARSYRDVTSMGSFTVFVFLFLLIIPGVFAGVNALADISPLNNITTIENGGYVSFIDILLSLLPYHLISLAMFTTAYLVFEEEFMLYPKSMAKTVGMYFDKFWKEMGQKSWLYVFISVLFAVPLVFIIENLLGYLLLPVSMRLPIMVYVAFALIEESVKAIPLYFLRDKGRIRLTTYAICAGLGFFIGEKLMNIYVMTKVYSLFGEVFSFFLVKNLLMTGLVHVASALALGIFIKNVRGRLGLAVGLAFATAIHVAYNLMVSSGVFV